MTLHTHTAHRAGFSHAEYARRAALARQELLWRDLDVLVITQPENICYLTGFETPGYHVFQALVVPREGEPFHVLRDIELGNARELSWVTDIDDFRDTVDPADALAHALGRRGLDAGRIGLECDGFFVPTGLVDRIQAALPDGTLVRSSQILAAARRVKSDEEITLLRRAAAIADDAILAGREAINECATDSDLAAVILAHLARAGSEYTGSPAYVVAGPASAASHATHAMRPIISNAWVELSASLGRYHAAASRVLATGPRSAQLEDVNSVSVAALEAMIAAMRPGVSAGEVDHIGRSLVDAAGLGNGWKHRAAYSLGVSFPPGLGEGQIMDIKAGDPRKLEPGMVFHLIPILAVPGLGSVGSTETVLVGETGAEPLTRLPREVLYGGANA